MRLHEYKGKFSGVGVGGVQWTARYLDNARTEVAERIVSYKEALGPVQLTGDNELAPASLRLAGHYMVIPSATPQRVAACGYLPDGETAQYYDRMSDEYEEAVRDVFRQRASTMFGPYLTSAETVVLQDLLLDRRSALWVDGAKYFTVKGVEFDVQFEEERAAPLLQHAHRLNPFNRARTQKHIERELRLGTLTSIQSPWASPCFTVDQSTKPEGRLVCDYRRVNTLTKKTQYPMPHIWDLLGRVAGRPLLSSVDAVAGFNQLRLTDRARERLAIVSPEGTWGWQVMPFGPCNGPAAFQQTMHHVFRNTPVEFFYR